MFNDIKKVLIIEDNEEIIESISLVLNIYWSHLTVSSASRGEKGLEMLDGGKYDLVILDLGLPDISGFEVLKRIRLFSDIPVIILTVRGDESSVVKGLELGADEYIVKPFRQLEFISRIRKLIRKGHVSEELSPIINGQFSFYPAEQKMVIDGKEISLTQTESIIMRILMLNVGHVVAHERIAEDIWGGYDKNDHPSLKTYIQRLRKKIEPDPAHPKFILLKHGLGYYISKTD